jgi:hypothetical protein
MRKRVTTILVLVVVCLASQLALMFDYRQYLGIESVSSFALREANPSISFQIVAKEIVDFTDHWSKCTAGPFTNKFGRRKQFRAPLHPVLQALTNFSTTLSLKNHRILVMGDSVAMQMFHMIDMANGGSSSNRTVVENAFGDHYSYALSSTANVGAWRTTGMFLRDNENKPPPNEPGGGWNATTARVLLDLPDPSNGKPIRSFDTILYVVPLPWVKLNNFRVSDLNKSLQLANEVFGVKKAILLTMPFHNNIDYDKIPLLLEKNREIQSLVTNFEAGRTIPGITGLVVMDFAELTFQFIRANAPLLGYLNDTDSPDMPYLAIRIRDYMTFARPAAAHVCAGPLFEKRGAATNFTLCDKNAITIDGIHMCPNTFGGRIVAATGCLLQCLNSDCSRDMKAGVQIGTLQCQKVCNDKFMTLTPIHISAPMTAAPD